MRLSISIIIIHFTTHKPRQSCKQWRKVLSYYKAKKELGAYVAYRPVVGRIYCTYYSVLTSLKDWALGRGFLPVYKSIIDLIIIILTKRLS